MSNKLVIYFSASSGGVTRKVSEKLAKAIEADLFEIEPEVKYTEADIRWINPLARCNREKIGGKDVAFKKKIENLDSYDTIYIGFPIWYGVAPNIVRTFVKAHDFSGKKVAVFATSGGSGIGKTAEKLQPYIKGAEIMDDKLLDINMTEEELKAWGRAI